MPGRWKQVVCCVLVWILCSGCERGVSRMFSISCPTKHKLKVHTSLKKYRCAVLSMDYNFKTKLTIFGEPGTRVKLGKFEIVANKGKGKLRTGSLQVDLRKYAKQPSFWTPKGVQFRFQIIEKGKALPATMERFWIPADAQIALKKTLAKLLKSGRMFTLMGKASFFGPPGLRIQVDEEKFKLSPVGSASIAVDLFPYIQKIPLAELAFHPVLRLPMTLQRKGGKPQKRVWKVPIADTLEKALRLWSKKKLKQPLFKGAKPVRPGKKPRFFLLWRGKNKGKLVLPKPRDGDGSTWQDLSGFVFVRERLSRVRRCGPYRMGGRKTTIKVELYEARFEVYDRRGRRRARKVFRKSRCPRGLSVSAYRVPRQSFRFEYRAWQDWVHRTLR